MRRVLSYVFASGVVIALVAPATTLAAAPQPKKTAAECNEELAKKEDVLRAAGESASAFIHDCWWHSAPGEPTPIAIGKTDQKSLEAASHETDQAPAGLRRRHARREKRLARRYEAAMAFSDQPRVRRRAIVEPDAPYPAAALPAAIAVPGFGPPETADAALPTRVNLNVPGIGVLTVPIVPIPTVAATVKAVVDHPVVPGIVSTSP